MNYGLDAELKAKQDAKYDPQMEKDVTGWIEAISGEKKGAQEFADWLKDGKVLCKLANSICAGSVKKVNESSLAFKQMENVVFFTDFVRKVGVPESTMFTTPDLYEAKNIGSVVNCIYTLGGVIQVEYPDVKPTLGVPMTSGTGNNRQKQLITDQSQGYNATLEVEAPKDVRGINKLAVPGGPRPGGSNKSSPSGSRNASPNPSPRGATATTGGSGPSPEKKPSPRGYAASTSVPQPPVAPAVAPTEDTLYGMDKELKEKQMAKYDVGLEGQVTSWIEQVTGESRGDQTLHEWLKSGQVLCKLINAVKPGTIKKVNTMNAPFKQMENIKYFMDAARGMGVPEASMFGTPDLYEEKNMGSVVNCINVLGGSIQVTVSEFKGPKLGIAINVESKDTKRGSGILTDMSAGFSTTMEVQRPTERADYVVKPIDRK